MCLPFFALSCFRVTVVLEQSFYLSRYFHFPRWLAQDNEAYVLVFSIICCRDSIMLSSSSESSSNNTYGLVLLLISAMLYSIMACFVKIVTAPSGLGSVEVVFVRAVFQGIFVLLGMCWYNDDAPDDLRNPVAASSSSPPSSSSFNNHKVKLIRYPFGSSETVQSIVLARGICGGLGFLCYYYTVSVLPLGDAITMLSMSPVITVLAASLVLHEPIQRSHLLAVVMSVLGSLLLARPTVVFGTADDGSTSNSNSSIGYLVGGLGACFAAMAFILVRRAGKVGAHTLQLLFSWCCFSILFSLIAGIIFPMIMMMLNWGNSSSSSSSNSSKISNNNNNDHNTTISTKHYVTTAFLTLPSSPRVWIYLLGVCIFGTAALFLMNYAGRMVPAGLASIIRSSAIMWSYILEICVFHQVPQFLTVLGFSCILVSLLVIALDQQRSSSSSSSTDSCSNQNKQTHCRDEDIGNTYSEKTRLCTTSTTTKSSCSNNNSNTYYDASSPKLIKATITHGYKDKSLHQTLNKMQTLKESLRKVGYDPDLKRKEKLQQLRRQNVIHQQQHMMTKTKNVCSDTSHSSSSTTTADDINNSNINKITNSTHNNENNNYDSNVNVSGGYLGLSMERLQQARQSLKHRNKDKWRV